MPSVPVNPRAIYNDIPVPPDIATAAIDNDDGYFIDFITINDRAELSNNSLPIGVNGPYNRNVKLGGHDGGTPGGMYVGVRMPLACLVRTRDENTSPATETDTTEYLNRDTDTFTLSPGADPAISQSVIEVWLDF